MRNDGYDLTIDKTLVLAEGNNNIKIEVRNAGGISIVEKNVTYSPENNKNLKQKRIALIIGNARYRDYDKRLNNAVNDATDIAAKLEKLGFRVLKSLDQTRKEMDEAIRTFGLQAKECDVALFYYSGHGIQYHGDNYLVPIDAELLEEENIRYECTNANIILDKMQGAKCPMKIVILDACRNNPFARGWHRGIGSNGLNVMEVPKGTFIAYATSPNDVALDGKVGERNSPYTKALLQTLDIPNLTLLEVFQEVAERVGKATNERQAPWSSTSFRGKFVFNQK